MMFLFNRCTCFKFFPRGEILKTPKKTKKHVRTKNRGSSRNEKKWIEIKNLELSNARVFSKRFLSEQKCNCVCLFLSFAYLDIFLGLVLNKYFPFWKRDFFYFLKMMKKSPKTENSKKLHKMRILFLVKRSSWELVLFFLSLNN